MDGSSQSVTNTVLLSVQIAEGASLSMYLYSLMALRAIPPSSSSTIHAPFSPRPPANTSNSSGNASGSGQSSVMSPELEGTLAMLSSHRTVLGYLLVSRGHPVSIIRNSGVVFEGEQGRKYASVIAKIVESVQAGLAEVAPGESEVDEVKFMRIRTRRHELMISPDDRYLLAVLHDPAT